MPQIYFTNEEIKLLWGLLPVDPSLDSDTRGEDGDQRIYERLRGKVSGSYVRIRESERQAAEKED